MYTPEELDEQLLAELNNERRVATLHEQLVAVFNGECFLRRI